LLAGHKPSLLCPLRDHVHYTAEALLFGSHIAIGIEDAANVGKIRGSHAGTWSWHAAHHVHFGKVLQFIGPGNPDHSSGGVKGSGQTLGSSIPKVIHPMQQSILLCTAQIYQSCTATANETIILRK